MRILLVVLAQAFLSGLLPDGFPQPDLYLLLALHLAEGRPYHLGLPIALLLGLLQDLLGLGYLGLHGMGLLFGVYGFYAAQAWVLGETSGRALAFLWAYLAKWVGLLFMAYWLRLRIFHPETLVWLSLGELLFTLGLYLLLVRKAR
ncbi:MAG: rod shape-determining protein MreD [Thermaceae bacterium]